MGIEKLRKTCFNIITEHLEVSADFKIILERIFKKLPDTVQLKVV